MQITKFVLQHAIIIMVAIAMESRVEYHHNDNHY